MEVIYIKLIEHSLLNREDQPCEDSTPDYSFIGCVETSKARTIGCRPGWETWSDPTLPLCTTMEQLSKHQKQDLKMFYMDQWSILNTTQCKIPCKYKEFVAVGDSLRGARRWSGEQDRSKRKFLKLRLTFLFLDISSSVLSLQQLMLFQEKRPWFIPPYLL